MSAKPSPYTYAGNEGPQRRAYVAEPGWAPPPPRPEPLPERCRRPLTFAESGSRHGPTPPAWDHFDRLMAQVARNAEPPAGHPFDRAVSADAVPGDPA